MVSRRLMTGAGLLLAVALLATLLFGAFQLGMAQGIEPGTAQTARHDGGWGPYGPGFGFGFVLFKLLFGVLLIFLIFGLLRAAFGGPRGWGPGPWGGQSWGGRPWDGEPGGPREAFEQWHQRAHERSDAPPPSASQGSGDATGRGGGPQA